MPSSSPILIETQSATAGSLGDLLRLLQGCWKCSSLLWMQANRFPVLPGLILSGWNNQSEVAVQQFCRGNGFSEVLVRIEKPGQRWTQRRGGYTIPKDEARSRVEELAHEGMLAILLQPASPYSDLYSLTSVCDLDSGEVDVEVVGTGFDASDILRADSLPHERFEILLGTSGQSAASSARPQGKRVHVVGRDEYHASVRRRMVKIGARLRNPSFPDDLLGAGSADAEVELLAQEAAHFLRESGQTALLDHADAYEPIPSRFLNVFLENFLQLFERIKSSAIPWRTLSLAASFLPQDRLVIWDFFPPGEQDTSVLCEL